MSGLDPAGRKAQDAAWASALGRERGGGEAAEATRDAAVVAMPQRTEPRLPPIGDGQVHIGDAAGGPVGVDLARLIDGRMLIQGNSGAGKSMLLRRLFEEAFGRVQMLLIDPDGEFATLSEILDVVVITAADARRVGGAALAVHIRQHRYSAVLDLADATAEDRLAVVSSLVEGLIEAPAEHWQPMLVLVDEAQTLAPHYDPGDVDAATRKRAIAALADLMGRGRKRGLAGVIATQRLAETAKAVVAKATNIVIGRTFFDRDLERAGAFLGFTAGHAKALRSLADGEFVAIGPAIAGPRRVRFKAATARSRHKGGRPDLAAPPAIAASAAADLIRSIPAKAPDPAPEAIETTVARRGRFAAGEDAIIVEGYRQGLPLLAIADRLAAAGFRRRAVSGISNRAHALGLASAKAAAAWSEEEDQIITDAYAREVRIADIGDLLKARGFSRGRSSIQARAVALGISRDRVNYWTEPEKAIVVAGLEGGKPYREIIEDLRQAGFHRGLTSIMKFAQKNNFSRAVDPWTAEQIADLKARYATTTVRQLAEELGKTPAAIATYAHKLGLRQRSAWTDAERQILIEAQARGDSLAAAAALIGRPYPNVAGVAARLQLDFRRNRRPGAGDAIEREPRAASSSVAAHRPPSTPSGGQGDRLRLPTSET